MSDLSAEVIVRAMLSIYHKNGTGFDFIRALEKRTGMSFTHEVSDPENLCYANSQAVRPEYKTSFTSADLWAYVVHHSSPQNADIIAHLTTIFPKSKQQFWETVNHMNI